MRKPKVDLKEQICRALENNSEKCKICGFIGKVGKDLFEHYSRIEGKVIVVCFYCHREELRKELKPKGLNTLKD